jgi:hypothetical protein
MVQRDPVTGKIVRINGVLDAVALLKNPAMDERSREAANDVVLEWTADLNQAIIDNLDFMEQIASGLYERTDVGDRLRMQYLQKVQAQLGAAGSLTTRLMQRGLMPPYSAQLQMQMTNEYVQLQYQELQQEGMKQLQGADPAAIQAQQARNAQIAQRYFLEHAVRDACEQFHTMLRDTAGIIDRVIAEADLPEEAKSKALTKVGAVKSATTDEQKMEAVWDLLQGLSFDQRRTVLQRAVSLGAAKDPYHPAPPLPVRAQG